VRLRRKYGDNTKLDLTEVVKGIMNAQPRNRGLIPGREKMYFSSLKRPDWLWYPPRLRFSG